MIGGTLYFWTVTVSVLVAGGIGMCTSGGFQIPWEDFVLIGGAGSAIVVILVAAGFLLSVRGQGCSVRIEWHRRLVVDRVSRFSRIFYRILTRSSCRSCP
jgi:hypothetical protein